MVCCCRIREPGVPSCFVPPGRHRTRYRYVLLATLEWGPADTLRTSGFHSYHLLLQSLSTIPSINVALLASLDALPQGHTHSHHDGDAAELVDGRAMLFAGASVLVKEYLYRISPSLPSPLSRPN